MDVVWGANSGDFAVTVGSSRQVQGECYDDRTVSTEYKA